MTSDQFPDWSATPELVEAIRKQAAEEMRERAAKVAEESHGEPWEVAAAIRRLEIK